MPRRATRKAGRRWISLPCPVGAAPRRRQAADRADGGGLAHAVAAEQRHHLPLAHREVDAEERLRGAVEGFQAGDL
jgi:hypothetical protein